MIIVRMVSIVTTLDDSAKLTNDSCTVVEIVATRWANNSRKVLVEVLRWLRGRIMQGSGHIRHFTKQRP